MSTSIDKYCYITCRFLQPFFKYKYKIIYSKVEYTKDLNKIVHPSVRESLKYTDMHNVPVSVSYDSDLPARSGLKGEIRNKYQLALDAIHVEQNMIKESVGSQDQVIAANGGLNRIDFAKDGKISVIPITINSARRKDLQDHLMMFFTGFSRTASTIAAEQIKKTPKKSEELKTMHLMVDKAIAILNSNRDINEFGQLLDKTWQIKRKLTSKISNPSIDKIYEKALSAGATGGKLLGAGGGGFMLIFAKPEYHNEIRRKLSNFLYVPFSFEDSGSRVIYYSHGGLL